MKPTDKPKSISILGCGWLGMPVGAALVEKGYVVNGSTTQPHKLENISKLNINPFLLQLPVEEHDEAHETFFGADVLLVNVPPKLKSADPSMYQQQMKSAASLAIAFGTKHVLFISSTSVYPDLNWVVTEDDANPHAPLVLAENIFRDKDHFSTTVLRFAGLVGEGRHPGRFLAGKENVKGANAPVNLIHLDDCKNIIEQIITQEIWGEVFNACADHHPARQDFYVAAARGAGLAPPVFLREEITNFKIVSAEKLKQRLAYAFHYADPFEMIA